MIRADGWRARLEAVIDERRAAGFGWGQLDCLTGLVAPCLNAVYGVKYFEAYNGRYKTAKGALALMRRSGFKNLAELVASELDEIHISQSAIGDVAAIPSGDDFGYSMGVVISDRVFVVHENGFGHRDLMEAERVFRPK